MKSSKVLTLPDELLNKRRCLLAGRGATLIWAALEAIAMHDNSRGEVILPDIVCPSVLEAVLAAGFIPRFAEVSTDAYSLTPETIHPHLTQLTSAVIVVHLFGFVAPLEEIADKLAGTGIYLIEDAVQAIGGHLTSVQPVGSCGDFSFVSFEKSKLIRGHGAILLYDDEMWTSLLSKVMEQVTNIGYSPAELLQIVSWRDLYHGLGQAIRQGVMSTHMAAQTFRSALPIYRPLLLRAFDNQTENIDIIQKDLNTLPQRIKLRNANAFALQEVLGKFDVKCHTVQEYDAVWRYTVQFPSRELADRFILTLRSQGGLVSNLYYPLHQLYQPHIRLTTEEYAPRLVNLWVDEKVDQSYIHLVGSTVEKIL